MNEEQVISSRRPPKYELLKKQLLKYIGELPEGQVFLPYEQDLAKMFNVGRTTVGHALKLLRDDGIISTSKKSGSKIIRRPAAGGDAPDTPKNVAFLFANTVSETIRTSDFRWDLCDELERAFSDSGVQFFVYNLREDNWARWRDPAMLAASLKERDIGFVVISPFIDEDFLLAPLFETLLNNRFKLTLTIQSSADFRDVEKLLAPGIDYVLLNTLYPIQKTLEAHYCDAARFFYIANEFSRPWSNAREEICRTFCREHGIPYEFLESEYLLINNKLKQNQEPVLNKECVRRFLNACADVDGKIVCFCANDYTAYSFITRLKELNADPDKYDIIGFDNEQRFRHLHFSSFTRDAQPQAAVILKLYKDFIHSAGKSGENGIGVRTYARFIWRGI